MANLQKVKIPTAVTRHTKLDLSCDHDTTLSFYNPSPAYYRHMIKGESLDVNGHMTVRPAPIAVPSYGRMRATLRAFFVPYRLVFPLFDNYYTDTIGSNLAASSLVASGPYFTKEAWEKFRNGSLLEQVNEPDAIAAGAYDYILNGGYYRVNSFGLKVLKVMHGLGYRIPCGGVYAEEPRYSALALLAWVRIYVDWYVNQNYLDSADVLRLREVLAWNDPINPLTLTSLDLLAIFSLVQNSVYDDNSYFVAAWDRPQAPVAGQSSIFTMTDISVPSAAHNVYVDTTYDGTPMMRQDLANSTNIGTTYMHEALKMLSDYQKRHQLASALPVSRYLAQFGEDVPTSRLNRATYVGMKTFDINIGNINSNASTEGASLGDYAGIGFGNGQGNWQFRCEEFGIFLVLATVQVSGGYWQGLDRHNNYIASKFDIFQPEADGLGVQAVLSSEVYADKDSGFVGNPNGIFGYTGRYGHYKRPLDNVTGSFEFPSQMIGGHAWHLFRTFEPNQFLSDYDRIRHSLAFTVANDSDQYRRIFQYTGNDADPFFVHYHFDVAAYSPCRPLFDTYKFEDKGDSVTLDQGAKVN